MRFINFKYLVIWNKLCPTAGLYKFFKDFVYSILEWNQKPDSYRFYWIGLNNLADPNVLEWVNTDEHYSAKYEYNFFGTDSENFDKSRRCTYALFSNNLPGNFSEFWIENDDYLLILIKFSSKKFKATLELKGNGIRKSVTRVIATFAKRIIKEEFVIVTMAMI